MCGAEVFSQHPSGALGTLPPVLRNNFLGSIVKQVKYCTGKIQTPYIHINLVVKHRGPFFIEDQNPTLLFLSPKLTRD